MAGTRMVRVVVPMDGRPLTELLKLLSNDRKLLSVMVTDGAVPLLDTEKLG